MNFSQGTFVMVGAVLCYCLNITWGLSSFIAVPITLLVCTVMGRLIERWIVRPFARNGSHAWLLSTIALGIITALPCQSQA